MPFGQWKKVRLPSLEERVRRRCDLWHKPANGMFYVNVGANFFGTSLQTGLGMVIRDDTGEPIGFQTMKRDGLLRVDEGEAWGVFEAIKWAIELGQWSRQILSTFRWLMLA